MPKLRLRRPSYEIGMHLAVMCAFANLLSHANRQILVVLVERINSDLQISDTQFGLLIGPSFAIAYAISTILIADLTDARSKVRMISIGVFIWSAATFACAFVKSFEGLVICRAFVGIGQSILSPAAYTLLASSYPKNKLGRISSVYATGSFLGSASVLIIGGIIADQAILQPNLELWAQFNIARWRLVFLIVGGIGLVYSLLFIALFRKTENRLSSPSIKQYTPYPKVLLYLWQHKSCYAFYILGFSCYSVAMFSLIAWGPAFFIRQLHFSQGQAGLLLAIILSTANLSGVLLSGYFMDKLRARQINQAPLIIGATGALLTALSALFFYGAFSYQWALAWTLAAFFLCAHFSSYPIAPSASANQIMTALAMRARSYAIFLAVNNLLAMGLGLTVVGYLNDHIFNTEEAVGKALLWVIVISALSASLLLTLGIKPYLAKLKLNQQNQQHYL
ncbi:MFS transporter [uncultured Pseudoteredinibacter sp.]|uniref:MFS transporter n=1 Tax=uncultured Pseudoteredinibacter sp. TaxID=1641701 RepID=UPI002636943B|nr:MFS transporter [uncultured Pseudoteredinibacter sp.]